MPSSDGQVTISIVGRVDGSLQASAVEASASIKGISTEMAAAEAWGTKLATSAKAVAAAEEVETVATRAATSAHVSNRAATESLVVAHEVLQGRLSRVPGSLMILAQAATGASSSVLFMGAGIVAAAAGIAYLEYRAYEAQKAVNALAEGFALTGREATHSADAVQAEIERLEKMPGVTRTIAQAIVAWEAAHGEVNDVINEAVDDLLPQYVKWLGEKAPEAIGALKERLQEIATGSIPQATHAFDDLNNKLHLIPSAQQPIIEKMIETGDRTGALNLVLARLAQQGGGHIDDLKTKIAALDTQLITAKHDADTFAAAMTMASAADGANVATAAYARATAEVARLQARLNSLQGTKAHQISVVPISSEDVDRQLQKIASDVNSTDAAILQKQVAYLSSLNSAHTDSATTRAKIESDLASKQVELARKTSADVVESARDRVLQEGLTGTKLISAEIASDKSLLADKHVTAQAKLGVERDLAEKINELHQQGARQGAALDRAEVSEKIAVERDAAGEIVAADMGTADQRKAIVQQMWADFASGAHLNALEQMAVKKEVAAEETQIDKDAARDKKQIDLSNLNTAIEISKIQLQQKKDDLQSEVDAGIITNAQKIALLREYATAAAIYDAQEVRNEINAGNLTVAAKNEDTNRIKVIEAKSVAEIAAINRTGADQVAAAWQHADEMILSSESTLISNILHGRQTLAQSLEQFALDLVEKEIEADVRLWSEKALIALAGEGRIKATEQGGFLYSMIFNKEDVAQTQAGEAEKTGAVTAGVTAQTAIKSAGAATSSTVEAVADSKSIMNSAYTSAAAAYKSVMQSVPPPANLVLAPVAAAGTFAAVMAYDTIASLDVGTNYVPRDMFANIHQGERVMPRADNEALMAALGGGGGGGGGDHFTLNHSPTYHNYNAPTLRELIRNDRETLKAEIMGILRNGGFRPPH